MKNFFVLLFALSLFFANASAQVYSQGDVSVTLQHSTFHDSSSCGTTHQLDYLITVQNSFAGDSLIVRESMWGYDVYVAENTTGQNPWTVSVPMFMLITGFVTDAELSAAMAFFPSPSAKVISGTDTIYNIDNNYTTMVPDACEYSTISGSVFVDNNTDCIFNGTDVPLAFVPLEIGQTLNSPSQSFIGSFTSSDSDGLFNGVEVQQSWMTSTTVYLPSYLQFIFPLSSCFPGAFTFTTLPQDNLHFALQCSNNMDVQCYVGGSPFARPAIPFFLSPVVNNMGCDAASGTLTLVLDPNVTYDASLSIMPADVVNGDTLIWNYNNLNSLSGGMYWNSFISNIHLTPDSFVNIGDTLCFHIYTEVPANDIAAWNNDYTLCIPVVNSYDPNMKEVSPAGIGPQGLVPQSTVDFTYTVHFQNTGTAPAFNVAIVDTLTSLLDPSTLQIVGASHAMTPEWLSNNVVRFNFNNINLPDSNSNEPQSHGFVTFRITAINVLPVGTQIENTAHIYFDSNPAIVTNTTLNTIAEPNAVAHNEANALVDLFPNPSDGLVYVNVSSGSSIGYDIRVEDCFGRVVKTIRAESSLHTLDASMLPNGIYSITVENRETNFRAVKKLVKQ